MNYIEDLAVAFMMFRVRVGSFDEKIARSLGTQAFENKPYTQKQSEIVLRLLKKYRQQFIKNGYTYIDSLLENPVFKHPIRYVDQTKHISLDSEDKSFVLKFPYNQELVAKLRECNQKNKLTKATWVDEVKHWKLELNEESLRFIIDELLPRNFTADDETSSYIEQFDSLKNNFEDYIPMLVKDNNSYKFKNIGVDFSSENLLQSLVASTKFGVYVFDDQVTKDMEDLNQGRPITKIFKHIDKQKIYLDNSAYTRNDMISIVKDLDMISAIFLYEESSHEVITKWVTDLTDQGVALEEIAVYFRRKNDEEGIKFNKAVKDLGLNKDASNEKVKWMFFGSKYPKVLVKNKKFADVCICENRYVSTHHSVINTMRNSTFTFYHNDHLPSGDEVVKL